MPPVKTMNAFTILPIELWQPILAQSNLTWSLLQSSRFPSALSQSTALVDSAWRMRAAQSLIIDFIPASKGYVAYAVCHRRLFGMLSTQDLHRLLFDLPALSHTFEHEELLVHFLEMPISVLVGQLGGHPLHTLCLLFQHAESGRPSASLVEYGDMFLGYHQRDEWPLPVPRQHWDVLDANYCRFRSKVNKRKLRRLQLW